MMGSSWVWVDGWTDQCFNKAPTLIEDGNCVKQILDVYVFVYPINVYLGNADLATRNPSIFQPRSGGKSCLKDTLT